MIGVIGLGKLGMPLAGLLSQYYKVIGVDIQEMKPEHNEDTELQKLDLSNLDISTDFSKLSECDIVFLIVPTPSKPNGDFTNDYIYDALNKSQNYLNCKLLVIMSTVMPGTCNKIQEMVNCDVAYNPEFIRLGHVLEDMQNPDFILIGGDKHNILDALYRKFTDAPIKRMDLISAEIAKIALNSYITMKITFANVVGLISKEWNADANKICEAIGNDKRIGHHYLKPGGAYGGPCFPRDNIAFSNVAKDIPNYSELTDKINKFVSKNVGYFSKEKRYQNV